MDYYTILWLVYYCTDLLTITDISESDAFWRLFYTSFNRAVKNDGNICF